MYKDSGQDLEPLLKQTLGVTEFSWLNETILQLKEAGSARKLYMAYALCANKIPLVLLQDFKAITPELGAYLQKKQANTVELSRIYLLQGALKDGDTFVDAVKKLIEVADKTELETFLKYLVLLPNPVHYKYAAVEALRTNISPVFEAISKFNPYPAQFFNEQQWNQMYLKAAFMQLDLGTIVGIDQRANGALATIISDYAHERWAASRTIDPMFWRPVSNFLQGALITDIQKLFKSEDSREKGAAALVCYHSKLAIAQEMLQAHPNLYQQIANGDLNWDTL